MYPNFYYIFKDWFGVEIELLKIINSFGFFVALSFLLAAYVMQRELKRKFSLGLLGEGSKLTVLKGAPMPVSDYVTSGITGFLLGFKLLPLLIDFSVVQGDPQGYILSGEGSFLYGILFAAAFLGYNYYLDKKQRLPEPVNVSRTVDPSFFMGELTIAAFIGGIAGAKLFHILENLSEFSNDPVGSIVSFSGLTFYGGLIVGGAAVLYRARKRGIPVLHMLDTGGPAMMLAYGTGRIGCHVSGDGDWGIVNSAPKPDWMSFLPDWLWSYDYPHNVNSVGVPIPGCTGIEHCMHLDPPVFPTPFYETVMALLLFVLLWSMRKRFAYAGSLFGLYLIVSGLERFLIEKIRVNTIMELFGMHVTQAEVISVCMMAAGVALMGWAQKNKMPAGAIRKTGTALEP